MGNIKIRSLTEGENSQAEGTNFVPVALDPNVPGIPQVTRKFNFNQIVSGGSKANNLYFKDGRVGIGTAAPGYDLEIDGDVNIIGNLYTGGIVVNVSSSNVSTIDKIIILNSGEGGAGVGGDGLAGLAIDRGTSDSGLFLFDETIDKFATSHGLSLSGDLAADGSAVFTQDLTALGDLDIAGTTTLAGDLVVGGTIQGDINLTSSNLTGNISGNVTGYFNQLHVSGSDAAWHQINPYLDTEAAFVSGSGFNKIRELEDVNPEYEGTGIYIDDYLAIASSPDSPYEDEIGTRKVTAGNFINAIISEDPRFGGGTDALLPKNLVLNVGSYTDLNGTPQAPTDALTEFSDRTMVNMPFGSSWVAFDAVTLTYEMHILESFRTVFGALQWAAKNCGTNLYVGIKIQGKVSMMGTYHNSGSGAPDGSTVTYVKQFKNFNLVTMYGGTRNATTDKTAIGYGRIDYDVDAWAGGAANIGMWFRRPEFLMGNLHWVYWSSGASTAMESGFRHGPNQATWTNSLKFDFLSSVSSCGGLWKELQRGVLYMFPGASQVVELGAVNSTGWFTLTNGSSINWSNNADSNRMIFTGKSGTGSHTNCNQRFIELNYNGSFEFVGGNFYRGNNMTLGGGSNTWAVVRGANNMVSMRDDYTISRGVRTLYWPNSYDPGYPADKILAVGTLQLLQQYGRLFEGSAGYQTAWTWTNGSDYTNLGFDGGTPYLPFWNECVASSYVSSASEIAGVSAPLEAPTSP